MRLETVAPPVLGKERKIWTSCLSSGRPFCFREVMKIEKCSGVSMNRSRLAFFLIAGFVLPIVLTVTGCGGSAPAALVLATTTSTQDSGLLDVLVPRFEKEYNVKVKTLAVGTGEALKMGEKGDADVLLVHSKDAEEEFVEAGFGLERVQVMYNDFIIVGSQADPAGIKGEKSAVEAFKKIAGAPATFVSRGDDSGTHKKELSLWKEAGIDPAGKPWYVDTGQGMGETLTITNQKQGYTLSDRATYVTMRPTVQLDVLVEGDKQLNNQYGVIVVNPRKHPDLEINTGAGGDFVQFLTSEKGQELIGAYEVGGVVLFHPNAAGETRGQGEAAGHD